MEISRRVHGYSASQCLDLVPRLLVLKSSRAEKSPARRAREPACGRWWFKEARLRYVMGAPQIIETVYISITSELVVGCSLSCSTLGDCLQCHRSEIHEWSRRVCRAFDAKGHRSSFKLLRFSRERGLTRAHGLDTRKSFQLPLQKFYHQ